MATNDFLPFAAAGGANVLAQADWLALAARLSGYTAGVANSAQINKGLRQSAAMAAMIGQFINTRGGVDALDNGDIAALRAAFETAYRSQATNYIATVGGTANALTITLDPAPASWNDLIGVPLRLLASSTNTASATLSVTGLPGTKPVTRAGGLPSKANDIMAGQILEIFYDGTQFQILSIIPSVLPSRVLPSSYMAPGNYTYVVPAGVYWVRCRVWGAGGGGGWANTNAAASGGNGGGYAEGIYPVTPGQSLPVVVGTFGAGGTSGANNGSPGGTSSVGSLLSATGGGGGRWDGTTNSTTGNGSGGQINISGGLAANGSFFGSTPVASAGGGAFSASGSGVSVSGGVKANYPGGGGGGGANNNNGAPGESGLVVIEPY